MENYFDVNGKYYAIDLDKFMEYVGRDKSVIQTINQTYDIQTDESGDTNIALVSKDVSEASDNISEVMSNYRYTMLTNILNLVIVPISDGVGSIMLTDDTKNMHLGQRIAFNTLVEMGIIYEVNIED